MLFILLEVGVPFFLACACIFCLNLDGPTHVVGGVGWRQFSTTDDIGIIGSVPISTSSTTSTFVGFLKRGVVMLTCIVAS